MAPELGQLCLILGLLLAIVQSIFPIVGAQRGNAAWMAVGRHAAAGQFTFIAASFALLTYAFVVQDFSVAYVAQNSNSLLPVHYRFSAVWGAHEGSLLLWVLTLSTWTIAVAFFSRSLPEAFAARVLGVMGIIAVGFIAFTLFTSNPFLRHIPALPEGRDLNPLLQDPGLIIHPPMLYMGYVGFSVAFAFAIAALMEGRVDSRWIRWSRPWTNVAWAFLTLGIALGSWWAYYELGWGGWWFWDPVENASFLPWLAGTALIHSQAVTEKRGGFKGWTILLAIAAFSLSLLGTFLVRSGVLTSVHAFASDPARGLFILAFLGIVAGGALILYAIRAPKMPMGSRFSPWSRESLLLVNNLFMTVSAVTVLFGTIYPLISDAFGLGKLSIGPPYFALMFIPLMVPVVIFMAVGPFVRWREDRVGNILPRLWPYALVSVLGSLGIWFLVDHFSIRAIAGIAGAIWVATLTIRYLADRLKATRRVTRGMAGMIIAHLGVAVFLVGVTFVETVGIEKDVRLEPGDTVEISGYQVQFVGVQPRTGPNFRADRGTVEVTRNGKPVTTLHPEKRLYAGGGQIMTEAAIDPGLTRDIYVSLGEPLGTSGAWAVRIYIKPYVRWIWLGALMMMFGGFLAATDRRYLREARQAAEIPSSPAEAPA
ncbi:MAG: heme lyase CcmF/NrfE family subunit [Xanthomonadales bacterium]|nr:heme lyase CcmF/NrfE family subunit [Xanthomonadales bacterium]